MNKNTIFQKYINQKKIKILKIMRQGGCCRPYPLPSPFPYPGPDRHYPRPRPRPEEYWW